MSKGGGNQKKVPVTEGELHNLLGGAMEQIFGGFASDWGHRLGQTEVIRDMIRKAGPGAIASALGTLGVAGAGAVASSPAIVGEALKKIGVPDGLRELVLESLADMGEGFGAERLAQLRQMSKPEAERALADHAAKKVAELSKKLETDNYDDAHRLLGIEQKKTLDRYQREMSASQQKEFDEHFKKHLKKPRDIADALEIGTDVGIFVGYLGRRYPAKPENKAQAAAIDFAGRLTKVVVGAVEKFVEDPKAGLQGVADDIEKGNRELEKKVNDARQRTEERKHKPFR